MIQIYYNLNITLPDASLSEPVSQLLGVLPADASRDWRYTLLQLEKEQIYYDFVPIFLDLLEGKYDALAQWGIQRQQIHFHAEFQFGNQCNAEWDPEKLKRMGENGIDLLLSAKWLEDRVMEDAGGDYGT